MANHENDNVHWHASCLLPSRLQVVIKYAEYLRDIAGDTTGAIAAFRHAERIEQQQLDHKGTSIVVKEVVIGTALDVITDSDDQEQYATVMLDGNPAKYAQQGLVSASTNGCCVALSCFALDFVHEPLARFRP